MENKRENMEKKTYSDCLWLLFFSAFVLLLVLGVFFYACRRFHFLILVAGIVLLGICAMICQTVLLVEQMHHQANKERNTSLDDEIIKAALNFHPNASPSDPQASNDN